MGSQLPAGTSLGRYEIRSLLGAGGMGEVYLAQDTKLDRQLALKILPPDLAANKDRMRRFVQEAKAASALNHPNIVTIYEADQTDEGYFIATEFVDGDTLRQHMRAAPIKLREVLDISMQIANALSAAHAAGIVHRDIKPDNLMLRDDGIVKVLDFGLAKLTEPTREVDTKAPTRAAVHTDPGVVMGTAIYMSPEQARGLEVDARTDIFSLGVVIYEMITGRLPFQGANTNEILASILSDKEPARLARYADEVPAELERIVSKALCKKREERYQVVKDMLLDLRSLKQQVEFETERERSTPMNRPAVVTNSQFATGPGLVSPSSNEAAPTLPATKSLLSGIEGRKAAVTFGIAALVIAAVLAYVFYFARMASAIDSIVVLPMANASHDPNVEYLSDGISEALINSLTELRQLRVVARSTAFRYKNKEIDPQRVGRDLNVRSVLMGRVREIGDTLEIQVDLVDATSGAQLWGGQYQRKISDVLLIKQDIAREITNKLRLRLTSEQQRQLIRRDTTNGEAYQFYLRGRFYWNKRTAEGIEKALEEFQHTIDADPTYALGYVGLADCYGVMEEYRGIPSSETLPKARAAAERALQLDDTLSEVHTSLAFIFFQLWKWPEAEAEYRRALALNPNYATAHHWFSIYFRTKRQFDDSMREIKRAQELDPLSPVIGQNVAEVYLLKNDLSSAIAQCQRTIELDPNFPGAHDELGFAYLKQRRYEDAIAEFQKTVQLSGRTSRYLGDLGYCFAVTGRIAEAMAILKELEDRYSKRESVGDYLAGVYAGLGDKDRAFAWLEKDFEQRSGQLPWRIARWFTFDDLRGDLRYTDLLHRMDLQL